MSSVRLFLAFVSALPRSSYSFPICIGARLTNLYSYRISPKSFFCRPSRSAISGSAARRASIVSLDIWGGGWVASDAHVCEGASEPIISWILEESILDIEPDYVVEIGLIKDLCKRIMSHNLIAHCIWSGT